MKRIRRRFAPTTSRAFKSSRRRIAVRLAISLFGVCSLAFVVVFLSTWFNNRPKLETISNWPASPQVLDRDGRVLFQTVGADDHWRIPVDLSEMSPWLIGATVAAEDQRFLEHDGVDLNALLRAIYQNTTSAEVVSGASTITMQLCRMMHRRPRSLRSKFIETVQAMQLEQLLSKREILNEYLNIAPYGGNVLGVEAAARRYYQKAAADLSLGEATLIAGLPQSPSRFRPDRFPAQARKRQRYVLERMESLGLISAKQRQNALAEPIRIRHRASSTGSHIAALALAQRRQGGRTTIDSAVQREVQRAVARHSKRLPDGSDVAVVVIDIDSSSIRALVGSSDFRDPSDGQVNGVLAKRSPGSALKPFIYATAFEAKRLSPKSVVIDQPIERAGWTPDNFDRSFLGKMTVTQALRTSRNVPAILVMEALGTSRCVGLLDAVGISLPSSAESRGGLSICVGTAETSLLQLTNGYATLGRQGVFCNTRLFTDEPQQPHVALSKTTANAINRILLSDDRNPNTTDTFIENARFVWKTGTSSGRRDAWAVGHNGRFAIGVWVGRFSGAGHTQFVGRSAAEPLLVELFSQTELQNSDANWLNAVDEIAVTRPLRFEAINDTLQIESPAQNATYIATESTVTIPVVLRLEQRNASNINTTTRDRDNPQWFLNGRPLEDSDFERLTLKCGSYKLRCSVGGKFHSVSFRVERGFLR